MTSKIAGPIYSGGINNFTQRKVSYSLFPVDGSLSIPVTVFKESVLGSFILSHTKNFWRTAGIELGSPH